MYQYELVFRHGIIIRYNLYLTYISRFVGTENVRKEIEMRICKQCGAKMEEGYIIKVTSYGTPHIEKGSVGFPSKMGTKGGEIQAALCPECGEISMYHPKESK